MSVERRGWVIRAGTIMGQLETGGARRFQWRAAALRDGTSRVMGDCQARICEGLGVKFPGSTRRLLSGRVDAFLASTLSRPLALCLSGSCLPDSPCHDCDSLHLRYGERRKRMVRRITRRGFLNFAAVASVAAVAGPIFDVKLPRGLDFTLQNSPTPQKYLIETMPGGVALFDYNNDGLLDIFLVNGGRVTSPMLLPEKFDRANPRYWNRLYRQNKDGSFTDATEAAGLSGAGTGNYGMGVTVGDYDNDGLPDLFVTSYGKNILYHNNGNGTFTDVTAKAGVAGGGWSVSAGFFDFDNDGKLDLFVTRYMEWDLKHNKTCGGEWHTYCPPEEFPAVTNILYHNNGDGTFTDVSQRSGIAAKKGRALGVAFADYDEDGFTDIFLANDGMQQYLFRNNGNGTFTERGLEAGAALSEDGRRLSGMGVVFQDYDNDGRPDVIVTELPREIYGVYHNEGNGTFSYGSLETGLGVLSSGSSGWGVGLEDFDNDGWKDLFVAQGHVLDNVEKIDPSLHYP